MDKPTIRVCMGSSCFSRGNRENLELIEAFLKTRGLEATVELAGSLCEGFCAEGPILWVGKAMYRQVDSGLLQDLLERLATEAGKTAAGEGGRG